jgi:hypothetical protein
MAILNQIGGISTGGLTGALEGPLGKLFGNKKGVQMFQYPKDLGNDPSRMHIVQFSIRNVLPRKFDLGVEESLDNTAASISSAVSSPLSTISSAAQSAYSSAKETVGYLSSTSLGSIYASTKNGAGNIAAKIGGITNKEVKATLSPKKTKNAAVINLYMPDTLSMSYNHEYGELNLADVGGGILQAGQAAAGVAKSVMEGYSKGGVSGAFGALGQSENLADATTALSALGGNTGKDLNDLFLKTQAKALNPQIQLLYRGVGLRQFTMEFVFTPKSKEEADQVTAIINTFNYAASPTISGTGGMYFVPPSEFEIKFLMAKTGNFSALSSMLQKAGNSIIPGLDLGNSAANYLGGNQGTENDRLFKIGSCILENITVDYAPNGWAAHENGAPVQTRLTLGFKELDIIDRNRLKAGEVR